MTDGKHILHFSLGPVQGFIGSARRTRDLWAGSFLLSWLTAQAMVVVPGWRKSVLFPQVAGDDLVNAVDATLRSVEPVDAPKIATVPNRFKAEVPEEFNPKRCEEAIGAAWQKLAGKVWEEFLPQLDKRLKRPNGGPRTNEIWEDQVANFWEVSWVKGPDDGTDGEWLDQRKTWRNYRPIDETIGGDHCTLMGDWQEISAYVRARDRADQDTFWSEFRNCEFKDNIGDKNGKKLLLDIVEGERLCAIALIKRLFPRLPKETREEVFGWDPCGDGGGNWPSTGHIAAVHWVEKAMSLDAEACQVYAEHVHESYAARHFAEQGSRIPCVRAAAPSKGVSGHWFGALDANFYFRNDLLNERAMPIWSRDNDKQIELKARNAFLGQRYDVMLKKLREANKKLKAPDPVFGEPAGYFALLRMDGDDVGKLLDTLGADKVSPALAAFSKDVPRLVENNNGVLVYAGGDDLLALFPIEDALTAALDLRRAYLRAWPRNQEQTVSAGLVFADHHEPFRAVVEESRRLLEDVAKDGNGRDSIACSVLKPSGRAVQWVSAWTAADCSFLTEKVMAIAKRMRAEPPFSNRFIYNLRTRFLAPIEDRFEALELSDAELDLILAAERAGSRELPEDADSDGERELVRTLRDLTQPHPGKDATPPVNAPAALQPDGLVLARFLAHKGLQVEGEKT